MSGITSGTLCHHLHANGNRCGSPALRGEQFCFYHHPTRRPPRARGRKPRPAVFHLPDLADRASIQRALVKVVTRTLSGRLSHQSARIFLVTLQMANSNLPGDPRQLYAYIQLSKKALRLASPDHTADVLKTIRPPRHEHKKCTESSSNS